MHKNVRGRGMLAAATLTLAAAAAIPAVAAEDGAASKAPKETKAPPSAVTGLKAKARGDVRRGDLTTVRGAIKPSVRGRKVVVQAKRRGGWDTVARTKTEKGGRFAVSWRPKRTGNYEVRVRSGKVERGLRGGVSVYRPAAASWYGPGLDGNPLGCGGRLSTATLGVAHKSLP
nr:hypothetical protein [Thermoleophilaceae bacterium]